MRRALVMLVRPPVLAIVALFAAIGAAAAQPKLGFDPVLAAVALIVAAWLVNAAALNDLADEAIDRVNLQGARGRPLVAGVATRRDLLVLGLMAGALALGLAWWLDWRVGFVVTGGLAFNAAYSLRPIRLSARGALASLALPSAFVVVPYLVGAYALRPDPPLVLLPGLYLGFVGRILLKDFRDVAGDALFGKWTFLLRHGRGTTCRVSGMGWVTGTLLVVAARPSPGLALVAAASAACAVHGLTRLAAGGDPIEDQVVIAAMAQAGRGFCITVLAQLTMVGQGWTGAGQLAVAGLLGGFFVSRYLRTLREEDPAWALRPS